MHKPKADVICTNSYNEHGLIFRIVANFQMPQSVIKYLYDECVSQIIISMENHNEVEVCVKRNYNKFDAANRVGKAMKAMINNHMFVMDSVTGLMAFEMKEEDIKPLQQPKAMDENEKKDKIRTLRKKLKKELELENYMKAAKLRDQIKELRGEKAQGQEDQT